MSSEHYGLVEQKDWKLIMQKITVITVIVHLSVAVIDWSNQSHSMIRSAITYVCKSILRSSLLRFIGIVCLLFLPWRWKMGSPFTLLYAALGLRKADLSLFLEFCNPSAMAYLIA